MGVLGYWGIREGVFAYSGYLRDFSGLWLRVLQVVG